MKRVLFFSLAVSFAAAMTLCVSCGSGNEKQTDYKFMSFNVRTIPGDGEDNPADNWENRKMGSIRMIRELQPDIIGTQEALPAHRQFFRDSLPEYTLVGIDRDSGTEDGDGEAMAVMFRNDRFELVDWGTYWLSPTPDTVSIGWDAACIRTLTWTLLKDKTTEEELFFMNTHFDHVGKVARQMEGELIVNLMNQVTEAHAGIPVVLTGDFNSTIDDPALKSILENMSLARQVSPVTDSTTTTYHGYSRVDGAIIDHIFFRGFDADKFSVITGNYGVSHVSDHYPVLFECHR